MHALYDLNAPKKATNLSLNSGLLKKAKALKLNLSATLEQVLKVKLAEQAAEKWANDNKRAIKSYNDFVEDNGLLADDHREF